MTYAGAPQYFSIAWTTSSRVAVLLFKPKTAKSEILYYRIPVAKSAPDEIIFPLCPAHKQIQVIGISIQVGNVILNNAMLQKDLFALNVSVHSKYFEKICVMGIPHNMSAYFSFRKNKGKHMTKTPVTDSFSQGAYLVSVW